MVDLSKHLTRARKAIDGRNYALAIEICIECQDVDPTNVGVYEMLVEAAKRQKQEGGKKGFGLGGLGGMSRDPHKKLSGAVKALSKNPDLKHFAAAGDAARGVMDTGVKKMVDVAIFLYEEARGTGLFNGDVLWHLANCYYQKFKQTNAKEPLDNAINRMAELEQNDKSHKEAGRTVKNWDADRSMLDRTTGKDASDARSQLADNKEAHRNEILARQVRTVEDADQQLEFYNEDLAKNPDDKGTLVKVADIQRRVQRYDEAIDALKKAAALDEHDFLIVMRMGEVGIERRKVKIAQLIKAGKDTTAEKADLLKFETETYGDWVARQPTEHRHKYQYGIRLFQQGNIDEAAKMFQKALNDPQSKAKAHNYLGHCFVKKKLFDMAVDQFGSCLEMQADKVGKDAMDARYNRARLYEKIGKDKKAIADYTKMVEVDLGFKDAAERLSALKEKHRDDDDDD